MNKTIILSTNDNSDYINYWSYVTLAWNNLGWNTLTFYLGSNINYFKQNINNQIIQLSNIKNYKESTVVQVSRLFGSKYITEGLLMTSDIDMMPLCDYWQPKYEDITIYGFDLMRYKQIPMCYISMNTENWEKIIPEKSIEKLLNKYKYAKSNIFNEYWYTDQKIISERILKYKYISIDRKINNGLALGRIDRTNWKETKNNNYKKIDAHLPRPFNEKEAKELLNKYHNI
jgi:hypothetical protein